FLSRKMVILVLILIGSSALSYTDLALPKKHSMSIEKKTIASNGASHWLDDNKTTMPTFDFSLPRTQKIQVSPLFERYYSGHSGTNTLGLPLTVAFPSGQGWLQFFEYGALLLPTIQHGYSLDVNEPL